MMTATQCPTPDLLRDMTLGILPGTESDALLEHLKSCPTCQSELETLDKTEDSLIADLRSKEPSSSQTGDPENEPACSVAVAKALGALAIAHQSRSNDELELPHSIGEYEIIAPLGRGGMGNVFLAQHTKLGRQVALKVIADHRMLDAHSRERFENEMRATGRLSHPNIVTAHDAREIDGTAVLVTEYIDGLDLSQLVQRIGPLSVADAAEIIRKTAAALQYTSEQGYVHRDIKPSNIMLSSTGEVKLLDLGLARFNPPNNDAAHMTGTGQTMGTADYIAPEQVTDSRTVDIRADIYSLGCTLYKLLTGQAPFGTQAHSTAFAKMNAHVSETPPSVRGLRDDVPAKLIALLDRMMAKDPSHRPAKPLEVAQQLADIADRSDLPHLITRAVKMTAANEDPVLESTALAGASPATQTWFRKPRPTYVAIAAGLGGIAAGLLLGILITIEFPDGRKVVVDAPEGTRVTTQSTPNISESTDGTAQTNPNVTPVPITTPSPLALAIQILPADENGTSNPNYEKALTEIRKHDTSAGPIATQYGTWYRVANDSVSQGTLDYLGQKYVLVSNAADQRIDWTQLRTHVTAVQSSGLPMQIDLRFDDTLAAEMKRLTQANMRRSLAIIVNDQVISSPRIMSPLSNAISITGKFSQEEMMSLGNAFAQANPDFMVPPQLPLGKKKTTAKEKLQGVWWLSVAIKNNQQTTNEKGGLIFDGGQIALFSDANQLMGTVELIDHRDSASEIDITIQNANQTAKTLKGIVEFHGSSRATIALNEEGKQRPTSVTPSLLEPSVDVTWVLDRISDIPKTEQEFKTLAEKARQGTSRQGEMAQLILSGMKALGTKLDSTIDSTIDQQMKARAAGATLSRHLKQIGVAFHKYHADHKSFPASKNIPADQIEMATKDQHPHSWRVALLPLLGFSELHDQYRFDEPWDSEANLKLLDQMPEVYRSPFQPDDQTTGHTNIQGFATGDSAMGIDNGVGFIDMRDGTSNTVLLAETTDSVPWTQPQDINGEPQLPEDRAIYLLIADGSVQVWPKPDTERLKKMITRAGGEFIDR
ncbi:protein kinase domain-containing protein [Stieleria varia]|uniref:Serine/threonine-protein kinase PknB n=1 Tax=Stieleria varia TaxID=2528005 RepID=A0A5C6B294_9BACT|nr:protein kinase [Stieleria varia]TWU05532.1 Serine/threonine-protein kinase PknB [Stieleria varia]